MNRISGLKDTYCIPTPAPSEMSENYLVAWYIFSTLYILSRMVHVLIFKLSFREVVPKVQL